MCTALPSSRNHLRRAIAPINSVTHELALDRLAVFTRAAAHILTEWDAYADAHVDQQGWPLDDLAYGRRQRRRDADTWRAFELVRPHMAELLGMAKGQFSTLPPAEQRAHWRGTLTRLDQAQIGLENAQALWEAERNSLPAAAVPGTDAYDEPLAERNADAWSYLCDWADGGHVLNEIARAATAHARDRPGPSPEHSRAQDPTVPPPQPPGHPQPRRPR